MNTTTKSCVPTHEPDEGTLTEDKSECTVPFEFTRYRCKHCEKWLGDRKAGEPYYSKIAE